MSRKKISWSVLFHKYAQDGRVEHVIFRNSNLIGGGELRNVLFHDCEFINCTIPHFIFINCTFSDCHFERSGFRMASTLVRGGATPGSMFRDTLFQNCSLDRVDFVMSSLINTIFSNCDLKDCDFRNVTWRDRQRVANKKWSELSEEDPLSTANMNGCRFGHPFPNMMSVPPAMMIPPSFSAVWKHMSEPQRAFLKLSYLMGEPPEHHFRSAV